MFGFPIMKPSFSFTDVIVVNDSIWKPLKGSSVNQNLTSVPHDCQGAFSLGYAEDLRRGLQNFVAYRRAIDAMSAY